MFPVRCFTCNKVIGGKQKQYEEGLAEGIPQGKILDKLKIERYCCRRMFLGYVPVFDQVLEYSSRNPSRQENPSRSENVIQGKNKLEK